MKKLLVFLFSVVSLASSAQVLRFPVDASGSTITIGNLSLPVSGTVTAKITDSLNVRGKVSITNTVPISGTVAVINNRPSTYYSSLDDMIAAEGIPAGAVQFPIQTVVLSGTVVASTASTTVTPGITVYNTGTGSGFQSFAGAIGRAYKLTAANIVVAGVQAAGYYFLNTFSNTKTVVTGYASGAWGTGPGGGESKVSGLGLGVIRFQQQIFSPKITTITRPNNATLAAAINSVESITVVGGASWQGTEFTDDLNFTAPYVIRLIGDSKDYGVGATEYVNTLGYQIREYYRAKGYDCRLSNVSVSGSTADQHEYVQRQGKYNLPMKAALTAIELSTNSFGDVPDSVANRVARIAVRESLSNPKGVVMVYAAAPRNDGAARETAMAQISAATQARIVALGNPRILFNPLPRTMWTATDASFYTDNVHFVDKGHLAWFSVGTKPFLDANVPTLTYPN